MFKGSRGHNYWGRRMFLDCFANIFLVRVSGEEIGRIVAASYSTVKHGPK